MSLSEENWHDLGIIWDFLELNHVLPERADLGIIGGSGNLLDTAGRAAELYHAGIIPLVVASGFANPALGGTEPEAELLAAELLKRRVPASSIIKEPHAANTAENITFSFRLLQEHDIRPRKIVLIHKPYMTRRFYATALANWPGYKPEFFVTGVKTTLREYYEYDKSVYGGSGRMISLMLGDFVRTGEYPRRGWMIEQEIPPAAEAAYLRLKEDGLTGKPLT